VEDEGPTVRLNVIVGYREFLQPFPIPWELLTTGFRTPESPVPPRFATAPWAPPLVDDPRYHGALLDPAEGTAELLLDYIADTTGPDEHSWMVVPSVSVLDQATTHHSLTFLRRCAELREVRLVPNEKAISVLRRLGDGQPCEPDTNDVLVLEPLGMPDTLTRAFRRNFSYHAAFLAARRFLGPDFSDVAHAAHSVANRFDALSLTFDSEQGPDHILEVVGRQISRSLAP